MVRDSRGFLWICTDEGLSRYDGSSFRNYTLAQGLPEALRVNALLEDRAGSVLAGTAGRYVPRVGGSALRPEKLAPVLSNG